jgi:hypothetical protein
LQQHYAWSYTAMARVQCPAATDLESWSNSAWNDGVQVEQLDPVDTLIVHTRNSRYEIIVVEPHSAQVLVRGGKFLPVYTPATLAGASLGGSFLKVHGVYIGFRMELCIAGETLLTAPVESIARAERAAAVS